MDGREAKDQLYDAFARTAKALSHPKRVELAELLAQGERSVEALATATGMRLTNTSAHLQVLAGPGWSRPARPARACCTGSPATT